MRLFYGYSFMWLEVILLLVTFVGYTSASCPCSDDSLCKPVTVEYEHEVLMFSTEGQSNYYLYDWDKVTTIAVFGKWSDELYCKAHEKNVRVVLFADIPYNQLTNVTYTKEWIKEQVINVETHYADGINIDFEHPITNQSEEYFALTQLVKGVSDALHEAVNGSQVSIDVPVTPDTARCFDYVTIGKYVDYLVLMAYDEHGQSSKICHAGANSAMYDLTIGIGRYEEIGIDRSKLIVAFPWYGDYYTCSQLPSHAACVIPCSSKATQICYISIVQKFLPKSISPVYYDTTSSSKFFNFEENNKLFQVWYDDPLSLRVKYDYVINKHLKGVGVWKFECAPFQSFYGYMMWNALPSVKEENKWKIH